MLDDDGDPNWWWWVVCPSCLEKKYFRVIDGEVKQLTQKKWDKFNPEKDNKPVSIDPKQFVREYTEMKHELEQLRERRKEAAAESEKYRAEVWALRKRVAELGGGL